MQCLFSFYLYGIEMASCKDAAYNSIWDCLARGPWKDPICTNAGFPLQMFAVLVYILMMANNLFNMFKHASIVLRSDTIFVAGLEGEFKPRLINSMERSFLFCFSVISELITWCSIRLHYNPFCHLVIFPCIFDLLVLPVWFF